ncbi:tetratricopeptide repeat protein [Larkinella insperata]|uniref:Tetratricopeptide repeat protein n=1 Tax=Larkinella insperata TaxID=332158 RepID=A0ABW3Q8X8_9BACT
MSGRPTWLPLKPAAERFPAEALVYARYGDLYLQQGAKANAVEAYQRAVQLDPSDQNSNVILKGLLAH